MSLRGSQPDTPGETIRPEPGLARGAFAAPPFFFYGLLGVTVLAALLWLTRRRLLSLVRRKTP